MQWLRIRLSKEENEAFVKNVLPTLSPNYMPYIIKDKHTLILYSMEDIEGTTYLAVCNHAAMFYNFRQRMPRFELLHREQDVSSCRIVFGGSKGEAFTS
jgi:hypothetical protein